MLLDPTCTHYDWRELLAGVILNRFIIFVNFLYQFSQNEHLKEKLFSTYPKKLVEASPHDQIWGIGLHADDPRALNESEWRGTNLLGRILTEVRDELLDETGFLAKKE